MKPREKPLPLDPNDRSKIVDENKWIWDLVEGLR